MVILYIIEYYSQFDNLKLFKIIFYHNRSYYFLSLQTHLFLKNNKKVINNFLDYLLK